MIYRKQRTLRSNTKHLLEKINPIFHSDERTNEDLLFIHSFSFEYYYIIFIIRVVCVRFDCASSCDDIPPLDGARLAAHPGNTERV